MTIVTLKLPPGLSNNGSPFENQGRWYDSDNMRWHEGSMRPLGGAHTFSTPNASFTAGPIRKILAWRDNSDNRWVAGGSPTKLSVKGDLLGSPSIDITPAGFTTGNEDGSGDTMADTWTMDTWGQYLVACATSDGKLYEWQLGYSGPTVAAQIANSPTGCKALVVTPERFLFALGADGDPRKVSWHDQGDNTDWTPTATNQAGSFLLETEGRLMCGIRARNETLLFTDSGDVWAARYIGQPLVYSFQRVGSGAAPISPNAVSAFDDRVFWMGRGAFYAYDGRVQTLSCETKYTVFDLSATTGIDDEQRYKVNAASMQKYSEAWWLYPNDATETFRYVTYNYKEGTWATGTTDGSAMQDRGAYPYPLFVNTSAIIEYLDQDPAQSNSWWIAEPYAESAPIDITGDESRFYAQWFYWDHTGPASAEVLVKSWGDANPNVVSLVQTIQAADFSVGDRIAVRARGRWFGMRAEAQNNQLIFGAPKLEFTKGGKR